MKTLKKMVFTGLSLIFVLTGVASARAPMPVECFSEIGYYGQSAFQASAYFSGVKYYSGGSIYGVSNCTVDFKTKSATATSVTVYGALNAPNNYNIGVSRTVYGDY